MSLTSPLVLQMELLKTKKATQLFHISKIRRIQRNLCVEGKFNCVVIVNPSIAKESETEV